MAFSTPIGLPWDSPSPTPKYVREGGRTLTSQPRFLASIGDQISFGSGAPLGGLRPQKSSAIMLYSPTSLEICLEIISQAHIPSHVFSTIYMFR